jgi:hypothetical protein
MKSLTIALLIATACMIIAVIVISAFTLNILLHNQYGSGHNFWDNSNTPEKNRETPFNFTNTPNTLLETRFNDPSEIPDCEYLTGSYGLAKFPKEGDLVGRMYCQENKTYHYEMIINNTTTHDTYWVKRDGGYI